MNVMDPHLRLRLAEWLAYHLSNFEYVWPWTKWQHVLAAPAYDGQRWVGGWNVACFGWLQGSAPRGVLTAAAQQQIFNACSRAHAHACSSPQPPLPAPRRRFCVAVLNRLVRLSYWERIQSVLPEEFRQLLPPKPEVAALPAAEAGEDPEAAAADPEGHWAAQMLQRVRGKASPEALDAWMAEQVSLGLGLGLGLNRL